MGSQPTTTGVDQPGNSAKLRNLGFVVLPLKASNGPDQEDVAAGLTAYLTGDLSRIPGSFVIARASAAALKPPLAAPQAIAARFAVRYVISGTAGERDGQIRLDAMLFDGEAGETLWSASFARDAGEFAAFRADVLDRIAHSVGASVADDSLRHAPQMPGDLLLRARAARVGGNPPRR